MKASKSAIAAFKYRYPDKIAVFVFDTAREHIVMPHDAIRPKQMNLKKDDAKGRVSMRLIGKLSCKSVLSRLGKWNSKSPLKRKEAQAYICQWKTVFDQYCLLEELFFKENMIMLFDSKYSPEFQPIEKVWRFAKVRLRYYQFHPFATAQQHFRDELLSPELQKRCTQWFNLARHYVLLSISSPDPNKWASERDVCKLVDLQKDGSHVPVPEVVLDPRYRFNPAQKNASEKLARALEPVIAYVHKLNNYVLLGSLYPTEPLWQADWKDVEKE